MNKNYLKGNLLGFGLGNTALWRAWIDAKVENIPRACKWGGLWNAEQKSEMCLIFSRVDCKVYAHLLKYQLEDMGALIKVRNSTGWEQQYEVV